MAMRPLSALDLLGANGLSLAESCETLAKTTNVHFKLRTVMEYASSNLRSDLSLPRLAMVTNLSIWHVCRLFKSELGISPVRYVKLLRLRCAASLLASTLLSVKEVMAFVGINDESHFVRDFRKFTGDFPSQYRNRHNGSS
jgi:AraC family transcriptional regulator